MSRVLAAAVVCAVSFGCKAREARGLNAGVYVTEVDPSAYPEDDDDGCPLGAKLELRRVLDREDVLVGVRLRNCSNSALWVNTRMTGGPEGRRFEDRHDLLMRVTG